MTADVTTKGFESFSAIRVEFSPETPAGHAAFAELFAAPAISSVSVLKSRAGELLHELNTRGLTVV